MIGLFLYQAAGAAVVQGVLGKRIQSITVADIMDREPVTIPAAATLLDAHEQFFLRYRWPWFAVVDPTRHFLGVLRASRVDAEISARAPGADGRRRARRGRPGADRRGRPLESRSDRRGCGRLGAIVAVDQDGVLRGVVTLAEVRRALRVAT